MNQTYEMCVCIIFLHRMHTFFDERITRCISDQQEIERMGSYKPRSGGIGKSLSKYSPELFSKLKSDVTLRKVMSYLEYTDLLDKPPDQWHTLKPLDNYAHEHSASWEGSKKLKKLVFVNDPRRLVRTQAENTPWQHIKNDLGVRDKECDCAKCRAEKEKKKAGGNNLTAESCEEKDQGEKSAETEEEKAGGDAVEEQIATNNSNEEKKENLDINDNSKNVIDNSKIFLTHVPFHVKNKKVEPVQDTTKRLQDMTVQSNVLDNATLMNGINVAWDETIQNEGRKIRR